MSNASCGCAGGTPAVPQPTDNPPQQDALRRRIGTHGTFLAALKAGLSAPRQPGEAASPLARLTTRDAADLTIALLDAWATVADVLTFYQERFANEAYLRTATERRSVLELARLVGYELRPGVAASLPLAFTLDATDPKARATIPAGTPAQSIPGPGEFPQTFETSEDFPARAQWNLLPVRRTYAQKFPANVAALKDLSVIYLQGVANNLKPGDALLLTFGPKPDQQVVRQVAKVEPDPAANRTTVRLAAAGPPRTGDARGGPGPAASGPAPTERDPIQALLNRLDERITLNRRPAVPTDRTLLTTLRVTPGDRGAATARADVAGRLLVAAQPALGDVLYQALQSQPAAPETGEVAVYVFRVQAGAFGAAASPTKVGPNADGTKFVEVAWGVDPEDQKPRVIWLDSPYPQIQPGSAVYVRYLDKAGGPHETFTTAATDPTSVSVVSRAAYNLSARTTRVALADDWFKAADEPAADALVRLRQTVVYAQPEPLSLAEVPIPDDTVVGGDRVALDAIVPDLEAGRLVVFSGERADLAGAVGVVGSEVARLSAVEILDLGAKDDQGKPKPPVDENGFPVARRISLLHLDSKLSYTYRRGTLKIYGNVALATHGESRDEVLGGGDASEAWSAYQLRQFPVTQLPAPTPSGAVSALRVRVHGVLWHEVDRLAAAGPSDQVYETQTDNTGRTTVIFGNGEHGARPATDVENIRAALRVGLGLGGNVRAGQVSLLPRPPAGVQSVTNPLPGTGGADPEGLDRARRNAPLGTLTLDRLVSLADYAAFARTFAGIGKAEAAPLTDGRRRFVHLTVAGSDDVPLAPESELLVNLRQALARNGDPRRLVQIDPRERVLLVLQAGVRIDPDYLWPDRDAALRQALVRAFPFEDRGMGRDMFLSEVVAALQGVEGVLEVAVEVFGGVPEREPKLYRAPGELAATMRRLLLTPEEIAARVAAVIAAGAQERVKVQPAGIDKDTVRPAQIAYFGPETLDVLKAAVTFRRID